MIKEIAGILRRYGNFMSGYDADGDEIDIDKANTLIRGVIKEKIEKAENPAQLGDADFANGFECSRQANLALFEEEQ